MPHTNHHKALVLQGGGALGSYQAGASIALAKSGFEPDWVIGTSIGAINGAIIAGNEPSLREKRLREFWDMASAPSWPWTAFHAWNGALAEALPGPWSEPLRTLPFLASGVPGFFTPRAGALTMAATGLPLATPSFYETSALAKTLEHLVDFDYLNEKHPRFTACAVDVDTGERADFDTDSIRVDARHVMASGALPPGFPFVEIDGSRYWDGGVYSNTPIDLALEASRSEDLACVMIDLWNPRDQASPNTFSETASRQKDIVYASRVKEHLKRHRQTLDLKKSIHELAALLPKSALALPEVQELLRNGAQHSIHIARILMPPLPGDGQAKDLDFTAQTVRARWALGERDGERLSKRPQWLAPLDIGVGMIVHELESLSHDSFYSADEQVQEAEEFPAKAKRAPTKVAKK